ncbi:MAG: hypothetical protein U0Q16_38265 [Bryobacteraceae bacterium]
MAFLLILAALCLVSTAAPAAGGIRRVDFQNFAFPWDVPKDEVPSTWKWIGPASSSVRLINGRHDFGEPEIPRYATPYVMLRSVTYGDVDGDGTDDAAVDLLYSTGGTANWHYVYVYVFRHGKPKLAARLQSGSRSDGGLIKTAIQNGWLVLDFADTDRRTADCCSEGYVRVGYRWKGGRFVEVGEREHGDLR